MGRIYYRNLDCGKQLIFQGLFLEAASHNYSAVFRFNSIIFCVLYIPFFFCFYFWPFIELIENYTPCFFLLFGKYSCLFWLNLCINLARLWYPGFGQASLYLAVKVALRSNYQVIRLQVRQTSLHHVGESHLIS